MASSILEFRRETVETQPIIGRVKKDVVAKAYPLLKEKGISWGIFIEAACLKFLDDEEKKTPPAPKLVTRRRPVQMDIF
jgi:hypothetical protein